MVNIKYLRKNQQTVVNINILFIDLGNNLFRSIEDFRTVSGVTRKAQFLGLPLRGDSRGFQNSRTACIELVVESKALDPFPRTIANHVTIDDLEALG